MEERKKRHQSVLAEDDITAAGAVSCNVSKSPNSLLLDISNRAAQQLDEERHCSSLNNELGLHRGSGSDVGKSPGSLKLR